MRTCLILSLGLTLIVLAACKSGEHSHNHSPLHREHYFTGDLLAELDLQYSAEYTGENAMSQYCDDSIRDQKYEIVRALEAHKDLILSSEDEMSSHDDEDENSAKKMGDFLVLPNSSKNKSGWNEKIMDSWPNIIQYYNFMKHSKNPEAWRVLNDDVRRVMPSDHDRIVARVNTFLTYSDRERVLNLKKIVQDCVESECEALEYSEEFSDWIDGVWFYEYFARQERELDGKERLESLGWFLKRLENDAKLFEFEKSEIAFIENNTLVIPVRPDRVGVDNELLNELTAIAWSKFGLNVKLKYREQNALEYILMAAGFRAEASIGGGWIRMPKLVNASTITHEFGHILGLKDNYFEVFDYQTCMYKVQYNYDDVMSYSSTGRVLPHHIEMIKKGHGLH